MSGQITTGSFPKLLWPGLNTIWGDTYMQYSNGAQWKEIFEVQKSTKNYEEDVGLSMFGLAQYKPEGDSIVFDSAKQGYVTRYRNLTYALGFIISQEEIEDNQYADISVRLTKALAFSMTQAREIIAANVLNNAHNASYAGGDLVSLGNANHPLDTGGTLSNTLSADLSEYALEQMTISIKGFVNARGNKINVSARKLVVPRQLTYDAERIIKNTQWRPDTANRDINALAKMNIFPEGVFTYQFLEDPDAFFILTNCPNGLKCMDRISMEFANDTDFTTTNARFRARERYVYSWTDFRGVFTSPGV